MQLLSSHHRLRRFLPGHLVDLAVLDFRRNDEGRDWFVVFLAHSLANGRLTSALQISVGGLSNLT
jgi:hypothetical protein